MGPDAALVHDAALRGVHVLDRVLDGEDVVAALLVEDAHQRREGRGLAAVGGPGDQHQALVVVGELGEGGRAGPRSSRVGGSAGMWRNTASRPRCWRKTLARKRPTPGTRVGEVELAALVERRALLGREGREHHRLGALARAAASRRGPRSGRGGGSGPGAPRGCGRRSPCARRPRAAARPGAAVAAGGRGAQPRRRGAAAGAGACAEAPGGLCAAPEPARRRCAAPGRLRGRRRAAARPRAAPREASRARRARAPRASGRRRPRAPRRPWSTAWRARASPRPASAPRAGAELGAVDQAALHHELAESSGLSPSLRLARGSARRAAPRSSASSATAMRPIKGTGRRLHSSWRAYRPAAVPV